MSFHLGDSGAWRWFLLNWCFVMFYIPRDWRHPFTPYPRICLSTFLYSPLIMNNNWCCICCILWFPIHTCSNDKMFVEIRYISHDAPNILQKFSKNNNIIPCWEYSIFLGGERIMPEDRHNITLHTYQEENNIKHKKLLF